MGGRVAERNRGTSLKRGLNLASLLGAQGRKLESILGAEHANDFCGNRLFVVVGQRNFQEHGLIGHECFGNERAQPALT